MSWRAGSAFAPLGAGNTAITVTTTTAIAAGERAILVVFRRQAASGTAVGDPIVAALGGSSFTTLSNLENVSGPGYGGLSFHSFIAPSLIASGATFTVTPGHANQKVAAMLLVQGDPHPTQAPYTNIARFIDVPFRTSINYWPSLDNKFMDWDKRLLVAVGNMASGGTSTIWSTVTPLGSAPISGFTEVLDNTVFSYGFLINVREQDSTESEVSAYAAGDGSGTAFSTGPTSLVGTMTLVRAGAAQPTLGPDVFEYSDAPSRNLPGSGSRQAVGQLWPQ